MTDDGFVSIDVDPGPADPDGLSMRFKRAGALEVVHAIVYESDNGLYGRWQLWAVDDPEGTTRREARCVLVDDSSDGLSRLFVGGRQGLLLVHADTHSVVRVPYLLLTAHSAILG